ncbi:MAG: hypothetical protein V4665_04560 [Patescibacteria group bacterium]
MENFFKRAGLVLGTGLAVVGFLMTEKDKDPLQHQLAAGIGVVFFMSFLWHVIKVKDDE